MSLEQLNAGITQANTLALRIAAQQPELAALLSDGTEVWLQELLAHTIGGDRAVAAEIQRKMTARHRD